MIRSLADFAVSIGTNGRVIAQGTILEVVGIDKSISKELQRNEEEIEIAEEEIDKPDEPTHPKSSGKLIMAEEIEMGHVSWGSGMLIHLKCFLGTHHHSQTFLYWIGRQSPCFILCFLPWWVNYCGIYKRFPNMVSWSLGFPI
jgi:hypothetical protein